MANKKPTPKVGLLQNIDEKVTPDMPSTDFVLQYNPLVATHIEDAKINEHIKDIDISKTPLSVVVKNVDLLSPEEFTLARRNGFGASDSSILMGVNPYSNLDDLIKQKASGGLSEEEKAISLKVAVRKGNDLEPLVIEKASKILNQEIIKPKDMYKFTAHPYMTLNFDGVINDPKQYIPCEIKVATKWGQKHYNPSKAVFSEQMGWKDLPQDVSMQNMSIESKAAAYGIPPYYYTQVQVEIMACNAPYGYLACIFDADWIVHIFMIWKDTTVQNDILINAYKAWQKVEALRWQNQKAGTVSILTEQSPSIQSGKDQTTSVIQYPPQSKSSNDY